MQKVLHCDCGFEARAEDEDALVEQVQRHASRAHGMKLSREHVLLLAFRTQLDESAWQSSFTGTSVGGASRDGIEAQLPDGKGGS